MKVDQKFGDPSLTCYALFFTGAMLKNMTFELLQLNMLYATQFQIVALAICNQGDK